MTSDAKILEGVGDYKWGFKDPEQLIFKTRKGLDREVVEQIRLAVQEFVFVWETQRHLVTLSGGVVMFDRSDMEAEELIQQAGEYCNTAKDLGRNRLFFPEDFDEADRVAI